MKQKFAVTGMTCSACSAHVDKAVRKLDGVTEVNVNLLDGSMTVDWDGALTPEQIVSAVERAGYGAGADVAIESADIVLMKSDLADAVTAAGLFGFQPDPMFAAAAMSLSSDTVVSNALRLQFFEPRVQTESGVKTGGIPAIKMKRRTKSYGKESHH